MRRPFITFTCVYSETLELKCGRRRLTVLRTLNWNPKRSLLQCHVHIPSLDQWQSPMVQHIRKERRRPRTLPTLVRVHMSIGADESEEPTRKQPPHLTPPPLALELIHFDSAVQGFHILSTDAEKRCLRGIGVDCLLLCLGWLRARRKIQPLMTFQLDAAGTRGQDIVMQSGLVRFYEQCGFRQKRPHRFRMNLYEEWVPMTGTVCNVMQILTRRVQKQTRRGWRVIEHNQPNTHTL